MRPSIIFFDEIDGLAPVRSTRQDQIHSSIVSTLLALMVQNEKMNMLGSLENVFYSEVSLFMGQNHSVIIEKKVSIFCG